MPDEPEFNAEDQAAQLRAAMDQAKEASKEFAELLFAFFSNLCESGFPQSAALALTIAYQTQMMASFTGGDNA